MTLIANVALGNGAVEEQTFDLADWDVSCIGMSWRDNHFGTRPQDCIGAALTVYWSHLLYAGLHDIAPISERYAAVLPVALQLIAVD